MQRFGIYSPVMGLKRDYPTVLVDDAFTSDHDNIMLRDGEIHRAKKPTAELTNSGGVGVALPSSEKALLYYLYKKDEGNSWLLALTVTSIYQWDTVTKAWISRYTIPVGTCAEWSITTFNNKCYATNGVDLVQTWDGYGQFAALGSGLGIQVFDTEYIATAKFVFEYQNRLWLAGPTRGGTYFPFDLFYSILGDTDFRPLDNNGNPTDAETIPVPGSDKIVGLGKFQDFLIIFKERSIHRLWSTGSTDYPFALAGMTENYGCRSGHSIINGSAGELYFLSSDLKFRAMTGMVSEFPEISASIDPIVRTISETSLAVVRGGRSDRYGLVQWAVPIGSAQTTNNYVLAFDKGKWTIRALAVTAFGVWDRKLTYTIDTIPFDTIDHITWPTWDYGLDEPTLLYDLYCGSDGLTYNLYGSDGDTYTGYFVLATDLAKGQALPVFKRLLAIRPYFRVETAGTVTLYVKRDQETSWQTVGTVNLVGTDFARGNLPCDLRARHFQIKVSGANLFRFVGVELEFVQAGER